MMSCSNLNKNLRSEEQLNAGFKKNKRSMINGKRTNHYISFHCNEYNEKE